jgi:hypothetical protein
MSQTRTCAVTSIVTVVLHITRFSGSTEIHELPAEGDYVVIPRGLLSSEDVLGFDVEVTGPDRRDRDIAAAGSDRRDPGGGRRVVG